MKLIHLITLILLTPVGMIAQSLDEATIAKRAGRKNLGPGGGPLAQC